MMEVMDDIKFVDDRAYAHTNADVSRVSRKWHQVTNHVDIE